MTTAQALETATADYLGTIAGLSGLTIYQHIDVGDPIERPALIVSGGDAVEDEWMRGIYRGTMTCQIEAHAQDDLTPAQLREAKGALLDALRCEVGLEQHVGNPAASWAPLKLRYSSATDAGATEDGGMWIAIIDLQFIAHR
jgi:hypothetical protein